MYEIVKNVIFSGRYDLSALLCKIDTLWVQGDLTDEQKTELVSLAQEHADLSGSVSILQKLEELEARVRALETEAEAGETPAAYPDYAAGKWYYGGDKVTFEGKTYICTAPSGQVCVWSPVEYPAYWQEATDE